MAACGRDGLSHVLGSTSFSFDISVFELFGPLVAGGRVEVVRFTTSMSPACGYGEAGASQHELAGETLVFALEITDTARP